VPVAVTAAVTMTVSPTPISLATGTTANITPSKFSGTVSATSNNTQVARVSISANVVTVKGIAVGTAVVAVKDDKTTVNVPVTVTGATTGRTTGLLAALVTVLIWTSFIVIARASTDPARGALLLPLDMGMARICGAFAVLAPWGWWLTRRDRAAGMVDGHSFGGLSPLPFRMTVLTGFFGGALYACFAYSGFAFAPAAHGSVLLPGGLPLWTSVLAVLVLGERLHRARIAGLVLIVGGGLLVGGASLLHALDGGDVWRGDLLFMGASICWSVRMMAISAQAAEPARPMVMSAVSTGPSSLIIVALTKRPT
jgi:drug/metabolite transporter (DMT)-like permease